jgi:hypothetical protein
MTDGGDGIYIKTGCSWCSGSSLPLMALEVDFLKMSRQSSLGVSYCYVIGPELRALFLVKQHVLGWTPSERLY